MKWYKCTYTDYSELPEVLFKGNTPGFERKSIDETMFLVRTRTSRDTDIYLFWMNGSEPEFNTADIKTATWL